MEMPADKSRGCAGEPERGREGNKTNTTELSRAEMSDARAQSVECFYLPNRFPGPCTGIWESHVFSYTLLGCFHEEGLYIVGCVCVCVFMLVGRIHSCDK